MVEDILRLCGNLTDYFLRFHDLKLSVVLFTEQDSWIFDLKRTSLLWICAVFPVDSGKYFSNCVVTYILLCFNNLQLSGRALR